MISILIVEDELPILELIRLNLTNEGYSCTTASDGMAAANLLEDHTYDLVLLDIMLPNIDGYELFEYIKSLNIPVIFITAKNSLDDKVKGLNLGAEDYIVKPFEIIELIARIRVVLRRYNKADTILTFADLTLDTETRRVTKNNIELELTPKEISLLSLFMRNTGTTLFREQIYESVWGKEYLDETRTVDLHIQRLRKKTGLERNLKTIYSVGYRLDE